MIRKTINVTPRQVAVTGRTPLEYQRTWEALGFKVNFVLPSDLNRVFNCPSSTGRG